MEQHFPKLNAQRFAECLRLQQPQLLDQALECYDRGFSIIPLEGKRPALAWANYQSQRATLDEIKQWFGAETLRPYNLGIVTGKLSGLVVVDADSAGAAAEWRKNFPATPLSVKTGGGGIHFYYRYPEGLEIGNRARIGGKRLDLRGEGGLVVAPPSLHPVTGNAYEWTSPLADYSYYNIPEFDPSWVAETRGGLNQATVPAARTQVKRLRAYLAHIEAVSGEGGHNATYRAACILREGGLCQDEAIEELRLWNRTNAQPPWEDWELVHKVESAYARQNPNN